MTCTAEDRITSDWVGLDGFSSSTVEQDGTVSQCFEGRAVYYSWYEMYPAGTIAVGTTVAAGDKIKASVSRSGSAYTLALTDSTRGANSFTKHATCATTTCPDTSAEWIAERPAYSIGIAPEAQFATVPFSAASETAARPDQHHLRLLGHQLRHHVDRCDGVVRHRLSIRPDRR